MRDLQSRGASVTNETTKRKAKSRKTDNGIIKPISKFVNLVFANQYFRIINKMGAPIGNKNAATTKKPWQDALIRALEVHRPADQRHKLDALAASLVAEAMNGNIPALKEIGDRLDGKAVQGVEVSTPDGISITRIERHIVDQAEPVKLVNSSD